MLPHVLVRLQAYFPMYKDTYIAGKSLCVTDMHDVLKVEYTGGATLRPTPVSLNMQAIAHPLPSCKPANANTSYGQPCAGRAVAMHCSAKLCDAGQGRAGQALQGRAEQCGAVLKWAVQCWQVQGRAVCSGYVTMTL